MMTAHLMCSRRFTNYIQYRIAVETSRDCAYSNRRRFESIVSISLRPFSVASIPRRVSTASPWCTHRSTLFGWAQLREMMARSAMISSGSPDMGMLLLCTQPCRSWNSPGSQRFIHFCTQQRKWAVNRVLLLSRGVAAENFNSAMFSSAL
jgi:hypothetical protein